MKFQLAEVVLPHTAETFPVWLHGVYAGLGRAEMSMLQIRMVYAAAAAAATSCFNCKDCVAGSLSYRQLEFTSYVERVLYGFVTYDQPPRVAVIDDIALRLQALLTQQEPAETSETDSAK